MSIKVETASVQPPKAHESKDTAKDIETEVVAKESAPAESAGEITEESETSEAAGTKGESQDERSEESEEQAPDESEEKPRKKSGIEKRIGKLTSKISAKDREIEFLREQLQRTQKPEPETKPMETKSADAGRPQADQFDSHDAYIEALTDWKVEQAEKARELKQKESQMRSEQQKQVSTFQERVKSFAESCEDFEEVLEEVNDIPLSLTVQEVILSSENGPQLMYELAKNKKEYERINSLPAIAAAREIGKFESRLNQSKPEQKEVKKTNAPKPISPVKAAAASATRKSIDDPDLPQSEYERIRREQRKQAGYAY